ncbi:MAG: aminotransferase class I/II-fold pyridoxal phosphate-dependent enzyme, partial [Candidatus Omnitrophica bacterium]|nr:aminotransferase class I/II-fold pyridoxal phosphate-dependent enzyme [Candidatus Omnitrophota bacterium]
PSTHKYALDQGHGELRIEIARWYKERFNVTLDPDNEILPLIGSKEGIAHIPLAFVNPGDNVLIPEPCYPPYRSGTIFAGGNPQVMPLTAHNNYVPDLKAIKPHVLTRTRLLFLNYPNNPTAATCDRSFFDDAVKFAGRHNIIVCHDAAYTELSFDDYQAPSFLEANGAKDVGIEFHSFSKIFNMTGWRLGFAVGNAQAIKALARVKSNIDSGVFTAIQMAGIAALKGYKGVIGKSRRLYQERRDVLVEGMQELGFEVEKPRATFYVWIPVVERFTSITFAKHLLDNAQVVVTPGNGFGQTGEGFFRMALTVDKNRLKEAVERIRKVI